MKKRGFTLIEIIISISLLTLIGVGSFFSIRLVNKNIRINRLEQITDKALTAAETYIETNKKTYNELYKKQNSVMIPLNVLVDEGLLNLDNTDIKKSDYENEYVITMLTEEQNSGECIDVRSVTSWNENMNEPIYICTDEKGNSNLAILSSSEIGNLNITQKERFYFRGSNPLNYIQLKGDTSKTYRILYVDKDDTLTIINNGTFSNTIKNASINQTCFSESSKVGYCNANNDKLYYAQTNGTVTNGECKVGAVDAINTAECTMHYGYKSDTSSKEYSVYGQISRNSYGEQPVSGWAYAWAVMTDQYQVFGWGGTPSVSKNVITMDAGTTNYKIHLNSCMKITSGTGDLATPYIFEDVCNTN